MKTTATILVAEDDVSDQYFVERAFKKAKWNIQRQFVSDGKEAIAYLAGTGKYHDRSLFPMPALILLDLKMPHLNGFEVLEWIKTQEGLKRVPVTVLSSSDLQSDINRAYELGPNGYLVKPVSLEQLEIVYKKTTEFFTKDAATPVTD